MTRAAESTPSKRSVQFFFSRHPSVSLLPSEGNEISAIFFPSMAERSQAEVSPLFCLPQEVLEKILLCFGGDWRSLLAVADTRVCLRPRLHING